MVPNNSHFEFYKSSDLHLGFVCLLPPSLILNCLMPPNESYMLLVLALVLARDVWAKQPLSRECETDSQEEDEPKESLEEIPPSTLFINEDTS